MKNWSMKVIEKEVVPGLHQGVTTEVKVDTDSGKTISLGYSNHYTSRWNSLTQSYEACDLYRGDSEEGIERAILIAKKISATPDLIEALKVALTALIERPATIPQNTIRLCQEALAKAGEEK